METQTKQSIRGLAKIVASLSIGLGATFLAAKGVSYWDRYIIQEEQRIKKSSNEEFPDINEINYQSCYIEQMKGGNE